MKKAELFAVGGAVIGFIADIMGISVFLLSRETPSTSSQSVFWVSYLLLAYSWLVLGWFLVLSHYRKRAKAGARAKWQLLRSSCVGFTGVGLFLIPIWSVFAYTFYHSANDEPFAFSVAFGTGVLFILTSLFAMPAAYDDVDL